MVDSDRVSRCFLLVLVGLTAALVRTGESHGRCPPPRHATLPVAAAAAFFHFCLLSSAFAASPSWQTGRVNRAGVTGGGAVDAYVLVRPRLLGAI